MSLKFILGRKYSTKQSTMYKYLNEVMEDSSVDEIIYLVPEYLKFESEMSILNYNSSKNSKYNTLLKTQVYSFKRLAWYFLGNTGKLNGIKLTNTGLNMLVRYIINQVQDDLTIFKGESHFEGFINQMTQLLIELRQGRIDENTLSELMDDNNEPNLNKKLHDIQLVYQSFLTFLKDQYIEDEYILEILIQDVRDRDLSDTVIFIDHSNHFTAKQLELVIALIESCRDVYIGLTLDKPHMLENRPQRVDLFYQAANTYNKIFNSVKASDKKAIDVENILCDDKNDIIHEDLRHIENYWYNSNQKSIDLSKDTPNLEGSFKIWEASTKQLEITHIANKIRELVSEQNYRYKDFLIMGRQLENYRSVLLPLFKKNDIPIFWDSQEAMSDHPLVLFIQSLLNIKKKYFRYEDIIQFLRTELFIPSQYSPNQFQEMVDKTENVMLAYGYEGKYWFRDEDWSYARFDLDELDQQNDYDKSIEKIANQVKNEVREKLIPFFEALDQVNTNQEAVEILYQFIVDINVKERLKKWYEREEDAGNIHEARKHKQAWSSFVTLLEEFVQILGDKPWNIDDFAQIMVTAFDSALYSVVPPTMDQVTVSTIDHTKAGTSKVVFIIGANDSALPFANNNASILSDDDRVQLDDKLTDNQYLSHSNIELLTNEPFMAYQALTVASEQLIVTYSQKQEDDSDHQLSSYIYCLSRYFKVPIQQLQSIYDQVEQEYKQNSLELIGSRRQVIEYIVAAYQYARETDQSISPFWQKLFSYIQDNLSSKEQAIFDSLSYNNLPENISEDIAEQLYGKDLYLSVSQLESYYKDPYSHFLKYGLKLRERKKLELTPMESGIFYHDVLEKIINYILTEDLDIAELTQEQTQQLTVDIVDQLLETSSKYKILTTTNQMQFIAKRLEETVHNQLNFMTQQFGYSQMRPTKTEVLFGQLGNQKGISGLSYDLGNDRTLQTRGKIDRIDTMTIDDEHYLQVIDYKSSENIVNFTEIYDGVSIQLMTYLETALSFSDELFGQSSIPLGFYYAWIKQQNVKYKDIIDEVIKDEIMREYRYKGLIISESKEPNLKLLGQYDRSVLDEAKEKKSLIFPAAITNAGKFHGGWTSWISPEQLTLLRRHIHDIIQLAGKKIISGDIELSPYKRGNKNYYIESIPGGIYHAISQFDVLNANNEYNRASLDDDIFEELKNKYEKGDKNHD